MKRPRWIDRRAILLLHAEALSEHGGLSGIRDESLLDSALARPHHLFGFQPDVDLADMAAAYAFGLARNHPFADGNKRAAFLTIGLFLGLNRHSLTVDKVEATLIMQAVASGQMTEEELASWIRTHRKRR